MKIETLSDINLKNERDTYPDQEQKLMKNIKM